MRRNQQRLQETLLESDGAGQITGIPRTRLCDAFYENRREKYITANPSAASTKPDGSGIDEIATVVPPRNAGANASKLFSRDPLPALNTLTRGSPPAPAPATIRPSPAATLRQDRRPCVDQSNFVCARRRIIRLSTAKIPALGPEINASA